MRLQTQFAPNRGRMNTHPKASGDAYSCISHNVYQYVKLWRGLPFPRPLSPLVASILAASLHPDAPFSGQSPRAKAVHSLGVARRIFDRLSVQLFTPASGHPAHPEPHRSPYH